MTLIVQYHSQDLRDRRPGALVHEAGEEQLLKAGDFALVNPEGLTQVIPAKSTSIAIKGISLLR